MALLQDYSDDTCHKKYLFNFSILFHYFRNNKMLTYPICRKGSGSISMGLEACIWNGKLLVSDEDIFHGQGRALMPCPSTSSCKFRRSFITSYKNYWSHYIKLKCSINMVNNYITEDISREILILSCLFMSPSSRSCKNTYIYMLSKSFSS